MTPASSVGRPETSWAGKRGEKKESGEGPEEQGRERKWVQQEVVFPSYKEEAEPGTEVWFGRANQDPGPS